MPTERLTPTQRTLLSEFQPTSPDTWMECGPSDRRTAEALARKGYFIIIPSESENGFFEVKAGPKFKF